MCREGSSTKAAAGITLIKRSGADGVRDASREPPRA
jgi:hypothetical protein